MPPPPAGVTVATPELHEKPAVLCTLKGHGWVSVAFRRNGEQHTRPQHVAALFAGVHSSLVALCVLAAACDGWAAPAPAALCGAAAAAAAAAAWENKVWTVPAARGDATWDGGWDGTPS
eukprot:gene49395-31928_t